MKIALIGKMCSGKTYVSKCLMRRCALKKFAFADKVKEIAKDLFNMNRKDRKLLQQIGQSMRNIDQNVWINYLLYKIEDEDRVIIDDVRYPNELQALKERGFTIIKLIVDKKTQQKRLINTYRDNYKEHIDNMNHISEMHIEKMEADYEIKSDDHVIENILKAIDPYYGKSLPSSTLLSESSFY
jgi:adenylate kinase family enzyme